MLYQMELCSDLKAFLKRRVEEHPDTAAFAYWDKSHSVLTEKSSVEFADGVERLGAWLTAKGYRGAKIAVTGENSYPWMLAFFAITNSGNVAALLDKSLPARKAAQLITETDCELLFYASSCQNVVNQLTELGRPFISAVCLDELESLLEHDAGMIGEYREAFRAVEVRREDLAVIAYTSGTSGKNKGVMLTHGNIAEDVSHGGRNINFQGRTLLLLPLHHMFGLSAATMGSLIYGGTVYINQGLRYIPSDILNIKPTVIPAVPAMLPLIYKVLSGMKDMGKVKIICGGAPADGFWIDRFRSIGAEIYVGYGMTECAPLIAVGSELYNRRGDCMKPIDGCEIRIDKPDKDGCGEILVRGPNVMVGYYKMEEETAEALKDGWLHTGDIGKLDEEGYLSITGRKKNLLILANGENVSAEAMERGLMLVKGVKECLTSVVDGKIQAEIYSDEADEDSTRKAIQEWNHTLDPARRIIRIIFRKTEFPKNSSQKIIRNSSSVTQDKEN